METKHTNKQLLAKGIRTLLTCLFLMFAGPTLLHIAFSNSNKPLYIPLLILSILLCIGAVYFLFKGIITIVNSMFNKN